MKNLIITLITLLCFLQVKGQDNRRRDSTKLTSNQPMTAHSLSILNFWVDEDEAVSITLSNLAILVNSNHGGTGDKFQLNNGITIIMSHDGKDTALVFDFTFPQTNGSNDPPCNTWTPVQTLNKIVTIHKEGRYSFYLKESDWHQSSGHHDGPISIEDGSTMTISR